MLNKIINKVRSFAQLEPGWCYGFEIPPNDETILFFIKIIKNLFKLQLSDVDVFPGDTNSIFVVPMRNDISLDIEVQNCNIISIEAQQGIGQDYKILNFWENVNYKLFYKIVYNLSLIPDLKTPNFISVNKPVFIGEKCLSESLTRRDMIIGGEDTIHPVLSHTMEDFQFLNHPVQHLEKYQYVITSKFISPQYAKVASQ